MDGIKKAFEKKRALGKLDHLDTLIAFENAKTKEGRPAYKKWVNSQNEILLGKEKELGPTVFDKRREALKVVVEVK